MRKHTCAVIVANRWKAAVEGGKEGFLQTLQTVSLLCKKKPGEVLRSQIVGLWALPCLPIKRRLAKVEQTRDFKQAAVESWKGGVRRGSRAFTDWELCLNSTS